MSAETAHKDNADKVLTDPANSKGPRTSIFCGMLTGDLLKTLQTSGLSMRSD